MSENIIPQISGNAVPAVGISFTKSCPMTGEFMACRRCAALERAAAELLRALEACRLSPSHEVAAWVRVAEMGLRKVMDDERVV